MATFSIKEIENITGIKSHTIRVWEKRYSLVVPKRTSTNIRFYDDEDLRELLSVALLQQYGVKISCIGRMSCAERHQKMLEIATSQQDNQGQIQSLINAMLEFDIEGFENIINTAIIQNGFENTIIGLLFPFLRKVGFLWQGGTINPCYEHFVSNIIRQKVIVAVNGQSNKYKEGYKKFVLFLPPHESHELSLLVANYMIRSKGHQTLYLGASLPYNSLKPALTKYKPDYVFTVLTSGCCEQDGLSHVNQIQREVEGIPLRIAGPLASNFCDSLPSGVEYYDCLKKFADFLDELKS